MKLNIKNIKFLTLLGLITVSGSNLIFSNELSQEETVVIIEDTGEMEINSECETIIDKRSPKDRAMDMLRDFLDLAKHPNKKWHEWIDEIHKELKDLGEYAQFCTTLIKLKGEKNALKVGEALKNYKHLLADDLKNNIENMLNNQKMKLFGILSTRIKK